jgi:hypothetical protein
MKAILKKANQSGTNKKKVVNASGIRTIIVNRQHCPNQPNPQCDSSHPSPRHCLDFYRWCPSLWYLLRLQIIPADVSGCHLPAKESIYVQNVHSD